MINTLLDSTFTSRGDQSTIFAMKYVRSQEAVKPPAKEMVVI
jgi:hypothetical protein